MIENLMIEPEHKKDYKDIISLIIQSFKEGTTYSDGTDVLALVEEIRGSKYYIPELSFVAKLNGKIVGHFMFSKFPISKTKDGSSKFSEDLIVMLAPVAVLPEFFRKKIGTQMLKLGFEKVKEKGFKGIIVEGDYHFYNTVGFKTSSDYGIYPTAGYPMIDNRCSMVLETYKDSLRGIKGYVVYDMYYCANSDSINN